MLRTSLTVLLLEVLVSIHQEEEEEEEEECKLTLFIFLKILIGLKNGSLLYAQTGSLSMQFCM